MITPPRPKAKLKRQILDYMGDYYRRHERFPSRRQIAAGVERPPSGYISRVVDELRQRGHLRAIERTPR